MDLRSDLFFFFRLITRVAINFLHGNTQEHDEMNFGINEYKMFPKCLPSDRTRLSFFSNYTFNRTFTKISEFAERPKFVLS